MKRSEFARLLRTAGHLRWSQIFWRLLYTVERKSPFAARQRTAPPEIRENNLPPLPESAHLNDPSGVQRFNEIRQGQLTCANLPLAFHVAYPDWRLGPQSENRLPAVTLHYHQWILDLLELAERSSDPMRREAEQISRSMLENWLDQCGAWNDSTRHLAWNSYAIATRLGVWARMLQLPLSKQPAWSELRNQLLDNAWLQADHLYRHIEWDLRANHLFRDALGLAWASRLLDVPQARRWRETAIQIATQQIDEQVLADGFHFERSPMYHLEMMHDIQSCQVLLDDEALTEKTRTTLQQMRRALGWLVHPDGTTMQWNDGRRCRPASELKNWSDSHQRRGGHWLGDAGWAVWKSDTWSVCFDLGPVGPRCQPGHAHADTLAVECSFQGQRLFVDPGNWDYDGSPRRQKERSTGAHNTVTCNGGDSSEVWHIFRIGRRAQVSNVQVLINQNQMQASGRHHGFSHQIGNPVHHRQLHCDHGAQLTIDDSVQSGPADRVEHRVEGGWLLEPGWQAETTVRGWRLAHPLTDSVELCVDSSAPLEFDVEPAMVCPNYHQEQPALRLVWRYQGRLPLALTTRIAPVAAAANKSESEKRSVPTFKPMSQGATRAHLSDRRQLRS